MITIEDGYQVAFSLAQVVELAGAAVAADPGAAIELAADGSCLRFSAGGPAVVLAQGQDAPPADVVYMRQHPLTYAAAKGDCSYLDLMRGALRDRARWVRFTRVTRATNGWIVTTNAHIDQRRPPYDRQERFMLLSYGVIDLETGLGYAEGPGRRMLQAGPEVMRALCDRLNAETSG